MKFLALLHIHLALSLLRVAHAAISCTSDSFCQDIYNSSDTICLEDSKTCSNPFQRGCLATKLGDGFKTRICNSDDRYVHEGGPCRPADLLYPEIRVHQGNWDTAVFHAWIYQILMMEIVDVPTTVGLTTNITSISSFYAQEPTFPYSSTAYPFQALAKGNQVGECATTDQPCLHILPEVWAGQESVYYPLIQEHVIEPDSANGLLGKNGMHVPTFTLQQYPSLGNWFGLSGEDKRELLASIFKRPTTWKDYCLEVSTTNCTSDSAAVRFPSTEEEDLYFADGLFIGHFRDTAKNNCTANPNTCSGHLVRPLCSWSVQVDQLLFWNGIVGLESDGPIAPTNSYNDESMVQIWRAANATRSHVAMIWYQPNFLSIEFFGSDFEFQYVTFPTPTRMCVENRGNTESGCSENLQERISDPRGACGDDVQPVKRLVVSSLKERTHEKEAEEAEQSPAYEFYNNIKITNYDLNAIVSRWLEINVDPRGNDAREAVCSWLVDNLETVLYFVPPGFPRTVVERSDYKAWYLYAARVLGAVVGGLAVLCLSLCGKYRRTKTMVFAQPIFLELILFGFCLICGAAIISALRPNQPRCTSAEWLLLLGYTIELVPVMVKTASINLIVRSSKKQKRVSISRRRMLGAVACVVVLVVAYLITWTVLDPSRTIESRRISGSDSSVVTLDIKCGSDEIIWILIALGWQVILLIVAAVLALQSRGVMKLFNESRSLALMVYSHFLFVVLRTVCSFFYITEAIPSSTTAALFSFNYTLDAFAAMCIYIVPKILQAMKDPEDYRTSGLANRAASRSSALSSSFHEGDSPVDALQLLVCTANMGNAQPNIESMETWIPPSGACSRVTPLEGVRSMPTGMFDLIAIGMQEATWKDTIKRSASSREDLTEEEVLNAMEEKNTAELREMVQEILGDAYTMMADERRGQMRMQIWASIRVADSISGIRINGANTGIGNVLANKGGIVTSFQYKKTRLSFLTAHLAAHEGESYFKARCENVRTILREAKTSTLNKNLDIATSSHHVFVFGDLNFRTKFGDEKQHDDNVKRALNMIENKDFSSLYKFDELQAALAAGDLLVNFNTLPCNFPPTFKVHREPGVLYTLQRTPSYTDRILYKSAPGLNSNVQPIAYEPCVDFYTSDHKPIRGAFTIIPNEKLGATRVIGEYRLVFEKMMCTNLPAGDMDGLSDPYIVFLWDSKYVTAKKQSFFDKLRALWTKQNWPRTPFISKTLNPDWGDVQVSLVLKDCLVGSDEMLYACVFDYDAIGKDTCLGVLALNLRALITMQEGDSEKITEVDQTLESEGNPAGNIKFHVRVKKSHTGAHHLHGA